MTAWKLRDILRTSNLVGDFIVIGLSLEILKADCCRGSLSIPGVPDACILCIPPILQT